MARLVVAAACLLASSTAADNIDAEVYSKLFMNNKPLFDRISELVREDLPERRGKLLDLGSGPGEPSVTLAREIPDFKVVCTDFQAAMSEKAKARVQAAGLKNVDFALTSADDLSAWGENEFDVVTASLVLMFVPDPAKAMREVLRVLKPGGLSYVAVWKDLGLEKLARKAMMDVTEGKESPPFGIDPMKMKHDGAVEELADAAGLRGRRRVAVSYPFNFASTREATDAARIMAGSALKRLEEGGDATATDRFNAAFERHLRENRFVKEDGVVAVGGNTVQILISDKRVRNEL